MGCRVVRVSVLFFVIGYGLALLDGVVEVGLCEGLEGDEGEAKGSCGWVEATIVFVSGFLSTKSGALEEDYDEKEREKGEESPLNDEIEIHDVPLRLVDRRRGSARSYGCGDGFDCGGSGLRRGRTLEEGGANVVLRCKSVVVAWRIRDSGSDRFEEEEERDEKEEESGAVVVRCERKDEEQ